MIPLAEWTPDLSALGHGEIEALNVLPTTGGGYAKFPDATAFTLALSARCQGHISAKTQSGVVYNYAGDATKLYTLNADGVTWNDASRTVGGVYATAAGEFWEFVRWGETIIATNYADVLQAITLGSANFAALSGSPPQAKHIGVVKDFVVLGNLAGFPNRVRWSAINDSTSWTVSAATQADYQDLQGEDNVVQKVVSGEFGLVFTERAIWKMTYIGAPEIFRFDQVEKKRGTQAPQSVVSVGGTTYYFADDGFYATDGRQESVPIGAGKVDKWFIADLDINNMHRLFGAADPRNKIIMWAYPGSGSSGGTPNRILVYHYGIKRWSLAEQNCHLLAHFRTQSISVDSVLFTTLEAAVGSFDDPIYAGGRLQLSVFDTAHKLAPFIGSAKEASVTTAEFQPVKGMVSTISEARPMVDGVATVSLAAGSRKLLSATPTYTAAVAQHANGIVPLRATGRYHRLRLTTSGDFNYILGVDDLRAAPSGAR